jgi:hypothetical protein
VEHCCCYPGNLYLFQTKHPAGFGFQDFPEKTVLACTLETNRNYPIYGSENIKAYPTPAHQRAADFYSIYPKMRKMISLEPLLDFDLDHFLDMIVPIKPEFVSIGSDSKGHNLPEPPAGKVRELIQELERFTKIIQKDNLRRILGT